MIDRENVEDVYSLSPLQEGILFHHIMDEQSTAYFVQAVITLNGDVDVVLLERAFNKIIEKYDILRTVYTYKKTKKPRQVVLKERKTEIFFKDISHLEEGAKAVFLADFKREDEQRGFNLAKDIPMRTAVLKMSDSRYNLVWSFHHIFMDGWCMGIIFKDLMRLYRAFRAGESVHVEPVTPYKNYIIWLEKQDREKGLNYWKTYLDEYEQRAVLPIIGSGVSDSGAGTYLLGEHRFLISEDMTAGLNRLARENRVTVNSVFQALWGVLLQVYNNTGDVVFGAVVSNRPAGIEGIEKMVGLFINTVPVRIKCERSTAFSRLIVQVQENAVLCKPHEYLSLAEIQGASPLNRHLIHHIQAFENYPLEKSVKEQPAADTTGFFIEDIDFKDRTHYDFNIAVGPGKQWVVRCTYNRTVYSDSFVLKTGEHLKQLIACVVKDPEIPVGEIDILTEEEKRQLLYDFNDTSVDYPADKTLHELFEAQAARTPDHIAVIGANSSNRSYKTHLSYRYLNHESNRLASLLREKGVTVGSITAVMAERSLETIIGLMAILKAGGAYLPIDPSYPEERINYMLEDSASRILLTHMDLIDILTRSSNEGVPYGVPVRPSNLAYVIYTSGSTGRPKGVMIEHRNAVNVVSWFGRSYLTHPGIRVLQMSEFTFDPSVNQVFGTLLHGGELHVISRDLLLRADALRRYIAMHRIHVLNFVPQMLKELLGGEEKLESVRFVLSGGEKLDDTVKDSIIKRGYALYNQYGPTETTIDALVGPCSRGEVNLGRPIDNARVYILDRNNRFVPIGVPGELLIGGAGVGRGYLNNPELTAQRFTFLSLYPSTPLLLYKTGDLARWLPDGTIEFLGRIDHQVKIRGFRIELGEIETQLMKHPAVEDAAVSARSSDNGHKYLCAYIVSRDSHTPDPGELREYLSRLLPDHMVPSYFIQLEKIPLTANGKIDRDGLPDPELPLTAENHVPPRNKVEETLVEVWQEILGVDGIGITDNFFEMGGDSIKAIQVVARLRKNGLFLKINHLFSHPQIKMLASYVSVSETESAIPQGVVTGPVKLTPIQHWFFRNRVCSLQHFNHAVMLYAENGFAESLVEKVFTAVLGHHDALRMAYRFAGETVLQENRGLEESLFDFEIFDWQDKENADVPRMIETQADRIQASIDLTVGPLVKVGLFKTAGGDHLLIVIHHLVVDGISWRILLEDFAGGYKQAEQGEPIRFPAKTTSFKDWSQRLSEYASDIASGIASNLGTGSKTKREIDYWKTVETPVIAPLPRDRRVEPEERKNKYIETELLKLDKVETETLLRKVNWAYNTEINDILLTALGLTLGEWSQSTRVKISLEGHGREALFDDIDISRTVGWFTSRYPVVLDMDPSRDLSYLIKSVKETLRRIPDKGIRYGILKYLAGEDILETEETAEISFNYLGQFGQEQDTGFIRFSAMSTGESSGPDLEQVFTLTVNGMLVDGELKLLMAYNTREYEKSTIRALADSFRSNLVAVIGHCSRKEVKELTPHDLGYNKISIDDLAGITRYIRESCDERFEIEAIYPLSPMQSGFFFHSLKNETSTAYFEQNAFTLSGSIDSLVLEESFNRLIDRYAVFRTVFLYEALDEPLQVVFKERKIPFHFEDISHMTEAERSGYLDRFKKTEREKGFDLTKDVLMKVSLFETSVDSYYLLWSFHHISMDGWCIGIVYKELIHIYQSLMQGKSSSLEPVVPYKNFIEWLIEQDKAEGYLYWETYLEGQEEQTGLPKAGNRLMVDGYCQEQYRQVFDEGLTDSLIKLAGKHRITVNTVFQAAWGVLLQKYNNTSDVVFGNVVSGRPAEVDGIENVVGLFINTIPMRVTGPGDLEFSRLATSVHENSILSRSYEYLSLAEIQANSLLKGNLIDHILVYENYPLQVVLANREEDDQGPGFIVNGVETREQTSYNLDISIIPGNRFIINYSFNSFVYRRELIETTAARFACILRQVAENPCTFLKNIDIVTEAEKAQLLFEFNDKSVPYPADKTVPELFTAQVERTPDRIALVYEDSSLTYRELDQQSGMLAAVLREKGIKPGTIAAVMVEKSIELLVGIMAIIKAGGAYLAIDVNYPLSRVNYMLTDSRAGILLVKEGINLAISHEIDVIDLSCLSDVFVDFAVGANPSLLSVSTDIFYVVYTSGSTGKPKGVLVRHNNYINAIYSWRKALRLEEMEVSLLQMASVSFDVFSGDLGRTLFNGGKMVICPDDVKMDLTSLYTLIVKNRISLFDSTPGLIVPFMDYIYESGLNLDCLQLLVVGSDVCKADDFGRLSRRYGEKIRIINCYGITETTIDTTYYELITESLDLPAYVSVVPIGKPLSNMTCYILDSHLNVQPIGISGELFIGGAGVSDGYLNNPELTAERFFINKSFSGIQGAVFQKSPLAAGDALYKTGDLARWLPDGNIEFLGRIDSQVKIRGYRVELGEIEDYLSRIDSVKESVVVARKDNSGGLYLCAYLVPIVAGAEIDAVQVRSRLSEELPGYMIPAHYVAIEKIPLTANGKIDRKALPQFEPGAGISPENYAAPETDIEKILVEIWQKVLGIKCIGAADNFFEIGGDSIKAIQVSARLKKYSLDLKINDLFTHPTIRESSAYIRRTERTISQGTVEGEAVLTPIQRWFFENNFTNRHHFNMPVMLYSEAGFREDYLRKVFAAVVEHHDALRMVYLSEGDRIVQLNRGMEEPLFEFENFDFVVGENFETCLLEEAERLQASLDLEKGPLVKLRLFRTAGGQGGHHLLIVIHHLVIDGISWRILLEDFSTGYRQLEQGEAIHFLEKTDSFLYWSHKLCEYAESWKLLRELPYWRSLEEMDFEPLPVDDEIGRRERKSRDSEAVQMCLSEEETGELLTGIHQAYHTNINEILLASLGLAVKEWAGIEKMVINLEGHGRENVVDDVDIGRTVGWFTSEFPVALDMNRSNDLSYVIKYTKETLRRIPNKGIGYGLLRYVTPAAKKEGFAFTLTPQISFNYLGEIGGEKSLSEGFRVSPLKTGNTVSPEFEIIHALDINGMVKEGRLTFHLAFNKYEYRRTTIQRFADCFRENLVKISSFCTGREEEEITPSDVGDEELSLEELENIREMISL